MALNVHGVHFRSKISNLNENWASGVKTNVLESRQVYSASHDNRTCLDPEGLGAQSLFVRAAGGLECRLEG